MELKRFLLLIPISLLFISCQGERSKELTYTPPPPPQTELDRRISGGAPTETPIKPPVDPNALDKCTRHLLFADQYITASDYPEAAREIDEAGKYCSPNDPRFNYMKAVLLDSLEKRDEAYKYYYRAAKGYLEKGDYDSAFKCYSGMLSINPSGKEVKELRRYFIDEDY
jgi:tetratricopeptide (TPR) repeat protein